MIHQVEIREVTDGRFVATVKLRDDETFQIIRNTYIEALQSMTTSLQVRNCMGSRFVRCSSAFSAKDAAELYGKP